MSLTPAPSLDLSLVLACFNEEPHIRASVQRILQVLDNSRFTFELIFVDDCSRDQTRAIIDELIGENPGVAMSRIFHTANTGRGGAVTDGFRIAKGKVAGYIDIDLEVDARYIPSCMLAIQDGADVATALRVYRFYWRGVVRWVLSRGYTVLRQRLLGLPLADTETGFKFFRRDKLLPLLDEIEDKGWFWDTEIMTRSYLRGYRIVEIPCLFQRRFDKRSTVNPWRDSIEYVGKLFRFRATVVRLRAGMHQR
jgi:glycosyltransferase involved in cell wall biosynthesis